MVCALFDLKTYVFLRTTAVDLIGFDTRDLVKNSLLNACDQERLTLLFCAVNIPVVACEES